MIKNYIPSGYKTIVSYTRGFYFSKDCGIDYMCDKDGELFWNYMSESAIRGYRYSLEHPEDYPYAFNKIMKHERKVRTVATGVCKCGLEIPLTDKYKGACQCPKCGQWYNVLGQELPTPSELGPDGTPNDC